jgi:hypothetical protein
VSKTNIAQPSGEREPPVTRVLGKRENHGDTVLAKNFVAILLKLFASPVLIPFDLERNDGEDGTSGIVCA